MTRKSFELVAFVVALLFGGTLFCEAAAKSVKPVFSEDGKEVILFPVDSYSNLKWRINNWKRVQKASISFPEDKTPTGTSCIRVDFETTGGGCNIVSPVMEKEGSWRDKDYDKISFWVRGVLGVGKVTFSVHSASGKYSWSFRPDSTDWKKVTLRIASAYTKKGNRKDLNAMNIMLFNSNEELSFLAGDFRLEVEDGE